MSVQTLPTCTMRASGTNGFSSRFLGNPPAAPVFFFGQWISPAASHSSSCDWAYPQCRPKSVGLYPRQGLPLSPSAVTPPPVRSEVLYFSPSDHVISVCGVLSSDPGSVSGWYVYPV